MLGPEQLIACLDTNNGNNNSNVISKRKRRPAGTPDPDAEVVSLSPKTLLESDRYVCEICNQGFQRDQNLQMHRRRHKVPWKLLKRETAAVRKRVFVCPEPSCLHHDPCHALGDLVGIKKHFRRKHSNHKQWVCDKCSKAYAVQSDYKAHLKTCGTRGHSCDCGRVFSRVESFIEHQDACTMGRLQSQPQLQQPPPGCLSRTASSPSPSSETNLSTPWPPSAGLVLPPIIKPTPDAIFLSQIADHPKTPIFKTTPHYHNLELQLLTTPSPSPSPPGSAASARPKPDGGDHLQLSIGSSDYGGNDTAAAGSKIKECGGLGWEEARAAAEKAYAEEAGREARRQRELAEREFSNAKRMRQQAQAEVDKAEALKERAIRKINATIMEITCHSCKQQFQARTTAAAAADEQSQLAMSYMSSAMTDGEVENEHVGNPVGDHAKTSNP